MTKFIKPKRYFSLPTPNQNSKPSLPKFSVTTSKIRQSESNSGERSPNSKKNLSARLTTIPTSTSPIKESWPISTALSRKMANKLKEGRPSFRSSSRSKGSIPPKVVLPSPMPHQNSMSNKWNAFSSRRMESEPSVLTKSVSARRMQHWKLSTSKPN